jgi:NADH-quinone oxidoreductase subunit F
MQFFLDEYETHIIDKHCDCGVCTDLYYSPCANACPAGVNVPGYMALVAAGRFDDAYELIRQDNPFPAVCGRICTHPCEDHCRRSGVDEALAICSLKRFIGDRALAAGSKYTQIEALPATGKKVAVIGAGPSGLTCAFYLALLGHEPHVYEAEPVAGGVLYWGIPEYRLPADVLEKEVNAIKAAGVQIHYNTRIGADISFDEIKNSHDAVYIAIGAQISRKLGIPGESFEGVETGLSFLRRVGMNINLTVPKRLAVIGGGSTAFDVARTAKRLGAEEVTIVYRRLLADMPAAKEEIEEAIEEGIKLELMTSPVEITGVGGLATGLVCRRREQGSFSRDGRRNTVSIPDSDFTIVCDGVIPAVNQDPSFAMFPSAEPLDINRFTTAAGYEGVFAGGDVSSWGENVAITAIAAGKRAASNIDLYLGGSGELNTGEAINIPDFHDEEVAEHMRFPTRYLPVEQRITNFNEVAQGYHKLDAMAEALRCLRCDRR